MDFYGEDLHLAKGVSGAGQCQRLCADYPDCSYFSFGSGGEHRGHCWLKRAKAHRDRRENRDRVSGPWICKSGGPTGGANFFEVEKKSRWF